VRRRNCATSRSINRHNVYKHKATSRVVWTIAACKINKEKKEKKRKQSRTKKNISQMLEELVVVDMDEQKSTQKVRAQYTGGEENNREVKSRK
tara:strand:+ start:199 stop:477 length:279 start_codon:yes stop_codon:yes gene_type:complete